MKTTITTIAALCVLIFGFNATAKENANPLKRLNSRAIALTYLQTISTGNIQYNKHLYTIDFEYRNSSNDQVSNKSQYLRFLKENKGLQYDCDTTYEILDETGNTAVGKATMKFKNFTRIDYITMLQTSDGWKVSKIVTTYP
ncbi:nuclear transport factor 2 family protein [Sphingobacterium faecale]|uniref:Nuclear transport factor 2 family protein n=1 Tax=Sphingobacterium faecale TaxID=2803775 RepID=A0ABS1R4C3_9SPHI|nr:nuclear transport factor 2 family protein [Sphingobacterium faecale]MBL1409394.1 nuclear transport factor 2 family protein [Sphingobacterium faecale]